MNNVRHFGRGEILGFEPLGFYAMSFHSWLCGYFPEKVNKELQIRPVGNGFIADFAEAIEVADYVRGAEGEPAIWLPWLVVRYDRGL
ncbi:MAG: hypothetical protein JNK87_35135 [Bryobacterales bacterium]|nr:hypothetical protein [Bryobacterales bacterium]